MESTVKLRNCPTSPRKMRLVADQIRGKKLEEVLKILKFSPKSASLDLLKLVNSGVASWGLKNQDSDAAEAGLYVKTVFVDEGRSLKRLQPAPQGRAYRKVKRSNHITLVIGDNLVESSVPQEVEAVEETTEKKPKSAKTTATKATSTKSKKSTTAKK